MALNRIETGEELRALRETLGLNQTEMGKCMGLSLRAYQESEGSDQVRKLHALAAERVAIEAAIENCDSRLMPTAISADHLAMILGATDEDTTPLAAMKLESLRMSTEGATGEIWKEIRAIKAALKQHGILES